MPRYKVTLEFRVNIVVERDGQSFHVYCPALKGLHAYGDTEEEAVKNGADAAVAYLESLIKHKEPIPVGIATHQEVQEVAASVYPKRRVEDLTIACAI
jgi:predicted RNase H-like HicB family nuclease